MVRVIRVSSNWIILLALFKVANIFLIWLNIMKIYSVIFENFYIKYIMFY